MNTRILDSISIKNFKTLKNISLDLNNVNVIIGNPNTGKSNFLEAMSWIEVMTRNPNRIRDYIRMNNIQNLFTDELIDDAILITGKYQTHNQEGVPLFGKFESSLKFEYGEFVNIFKEEVDIRGDFKNPEEEADNKYRFSFEGGYQGGHTSGNEIVKFLNKQIIKFYKYKEAQKYPNSSLSYLIPPHGENLFQLTYGKKEFREFIKDFMKSFNFDLIFRPQDQTWEIEKHIKGDTRVSLPYNTLADTIKQILFYSLAVKSNDSSILLFEEPEGHTFPYYTKYLAQLIANNLSNQYLLVTHNPYFLKTLIEKIPSDQLNIYIAYLDNFDTKLHQATNEQIEEMLEIDPFFNLDNFVEE